MREKRMADVLAACLAASGGETLADEMAELTGREHEDLASLVCLAGQLDTRMRPLKAPPVFARSLRQELVREAERRFSMRQRRRRIALIGGAAAGAVVSIVSLVGGLVVLIKWLRTRTEARQASAA